MYGNGLDPHKRDFLKKKKTNVNNWYFDLRKVISVPSGLYLWYIGIKKANVHYTY